MEQRDYLLMQVEQLGQVLGKIFLKLSNFKGSNIMTITMANHFLNDAKMDITQLCAIDDSKLIDTLINEKNFNNSCLEQLANIFFLIAQNIDDDKRGLLYEKRNHKIKEIESLMNSERD